jgi:hypothetical protein
LRYALRKKPYFHSYKIYLMKTKFYLPALLIALSALFFACQKETSYEIGNAPSDYFPRTANSNWSYQFDGNPDDSLLISVISTPLQANGMTYSIFMTHLTAPLDSFGYFRRSGGDYYEWVDMGSLVGFDNPIWMEYIFLKDNKVVNDTWSSSDFSGTYTPSGGQPISITLRWDFTILQQNATVTVNGVDYPNTIEVKQDLKQLVSGNPVSIGYYNSYYSRDKGLIKKDLYDDQGGLLQEMDVRRIAIY